MRGRAAVLALARSFRQPLLYIYTTYPWLSGAVVRTVLWTEHVMAPEGMPVARFAGIVNPSENLLSAPEWWGSDPSPPVLGHDRQARPARPVLSWITEE